MTESRVIAGAGHALPLTESPLTGTTFANWLRLLARYGPVERRPLFLARAAFISAFTLALSPFHLAEALVAGPKVRSVSVREDPLFLLGFFRSGTTHLHRMLAQDPQWGYLDSAQCFSPGTMFVAHRLFRTMVGAFMPRTRPHDSVEMAVDHPEEDEHALSNLSPFGLYHATYFPRRWRDVVRRYGLLDGLDDDELAEWQRAYHGVVQKATLASNGKRLLLKNPAHLARLPALLALYPNARFVFLHRNPFTLFHSLRNFYVKEMQAASLQDIDRAELDEMIFETFDTMVERFFRDCHLIPEGHLVSLSFEALEADPLAEIGRVYEALSLPGFDAMRPRLSRYLADVGGYRKNSYDYDDRTVRRIAERWRSPIERWGYETP